MSDHTLPLEMLYQWEEQLPDQICLRQPFPGEGYREMTRAQMMAQVRSMAAVLKAKGFAPGSPIAILSKNCAHWIMADYAIWMAGHVSVPLYPNLAGSSVKAILEHSGCQLAFVGKLDNLEAYRSAVPAGVPCIAFPYHTVRASESWDSLVAKTPGLSGKPARRAEETATIIYTSGTTGEPKGVMHSFKAFAVAGSQTVREAKVQKATRFFSYLPMAHVAERIIVETASVYCAGVISFVESLDSFQKNIQSVQPEVFVAVPRLWQKFQSGILAKLPPNKLSLLLKIPIVSTLIKHKLQTSLGLRHAKIIITGGAPTPPSLIRWFQSIGIVIQEAYGLTENFAYSHYNHRDRVRVGTAGTPWPGVKTRIAESGEILVDSPCSFQGYYKQEDRRAESFDGAYLKTGDLGAIDADGYLRITGRLKEIFKTTKGKYIAPAPIEARLSESLLLESVCVVGNDLPNPIALVTLLPGTKRAEAKVALTALVQAVNAKLDPHEQLAKLVVVKDVWSPDTGELTPTLKVKRNVVEACYAARLSVWSAQTDRVIWDE